MAQFPSLTITQAGIEMIAASQGGATLIFTRMKMGDGDSTNVDAMTLQDLIAPKIAIAISSIDTTTSSGQIRLTASVNNSAVNAGFFTKELGVFAKIGSTGTEKLYAYTNAGSYCDYMPSKETPVDENTIRVTLVVANTANTTALVDPSVAFLTEAETTAKITTHNGDASAHSAMITSHNNDSNAHSTTIGTKISTHNGNESAHSALFAKYLSLAGGTCTGALYAPTAAAGTNDTQVATTAFVAGSYVSKTGDTMSGGLTAPAVTATTTMNIPGGKIWIG